MERPECLRREAGRWRGSDVQPCEFISSAYQGRDFTKVLPEVPASRPRPEKNEGVLGGGGVADSVFTHNELCASVGDWSPSQGRFLRVSVSSQRHFYSDGLWIFDQNWSKPSHTVMTRQ